MLRFEINIEVIIFVKNKLYTMNKLVTFVLSIFLLMPFLVSSQEGANYPIDTDTKLITYQEVVQQNGSQDELYIRAIEWINTYYKNPADVCRIRNRESGVIEILHRFEVVSPETNLNVGIVNYELKMEFKPGRYRYTISNLTLRQASRFPVEKWLDKSDTGYTPVYDNYMQQVDKQVNELISSFKAGLSPVELKPEEKW